MFKNWFVCNRKGIKTNDICVKIKVKLKTIVRNSNTLALHNDII